MNSRLTRLAAAASAVVLTFGLAACSGDDADKEPGTKSATTGSPTKGEDPATGGEPADDAPGAAGGLTQNNFVDRLTAAQRKAATSRVRMNIEAQGQKSVANGQVRTGSTIKDSAVAMSIDATGAGVGVMEMRIVDGAFYLKFGDMTQGKFVLMDPKADDPLADQLTNLMEQVNPTKQVKQFGEALKSFERTGSPKTIDGVAAQAYELVLDTSKLARVPGASASDTKLPKTLTYTVFVGPDDLPRRISAKIVGLSFTANYTQWGKPVDIEKPTASQITDKGLSTQ